MTAKAAATPWGLTRVSELSKMVELPYTEITTPYASPTTTARSEGLHL